MNQQSTAASQQFATLTAIADGIAALFFPMVEVAIHDVTSSKIAYLANNLSKRSIGDDAGLEQLTLNELDTLTGPYEQLNWDGKKMRSVSIRASVPGSAGYIFCINFSTAMLEDARNALETFLSMSPLQPQPAPLFAHDWREKINTAVHQWLAENHSSLTILTRSDKKALVTALYAQGIFNVRHSADYVANVLSLGRATVFKYLKEIKG